jgi:hypothetical protein
MSTEAFVLGRRVADAVLVLHSVPLPTDGERGSAFRKWAEARSRECGLAALLESPGERPTP